MPASDDEALGLAALEAFGTAKDGVKIDPVHATRAARIEPPNVGPRCQATFQMLAMFDFEIDGTVSTVAPELSIRIVFVVVGTPPGVISRAWTSRSPGSNTRSHTTA